MYILLRLGIIQTLQVSDRLENSEKYMVKYTYYLYAEYIIRRPNFYRFLIVIKIFLEFCIPWK